MERGTPEWYLALGTATNRLTHATRMVTRWQNEVVEREKAVAELTGIPIVGTNGNTEQATEPEQPPA